MQIVKRLKLSALKKHKKPFRGTLFLPEMREAAAKQDAAMLREIIAAIPITDLALIWHHFTEKEKGFITDNVTPEERVELFEKANLKQKNWFLKNLSAGQLKNVVENMPPDERADLFGDVPEKDRDKYFSNVSEKLKKETESLAKYSSDTAGGLMSTDFIMLDSGMKVGESLEMLRESLRKRMRNVYAIYVNNSEGKLVGGISLRRFLSLRAEDIVGEHAKIEYVTIPVGWDQEEVAMAFTTYDLLACPVIDENDKMLGVITVDDILDVINEEATEDIYGMASISDAKEAAHTDFNSFSSWELAKKRIPWLIVMLFIGAVVSGQILKSNRILLQQFALLAAFIPILMGAGGNSGSQALVLFVRAVAMKQAVFSDFFKILIRELKASVIIGIILGIFGILASFLIAGLNIQIAITVFLSLFCIILLSNIIGIMLPVTISYFKGDPAFISAPLLTAMVDGIALLIYFEIAKKLLS